MEKTIRTKESPICLTFVAPQENIRKYWLRLFTMAATAILLLLSSASFSQYTATWSLTSNKTVAKGGAQAAMINVSDMVPGATFAAGSHNTDGFQNAISTGNWPDVATDGMHMDYPFSPNGNVDVVLSGLTLTARTSGGSGNNMISLAYQVNGAGPWVPFGTPQVAPSGGTNNLTFGTLTQKFYSGNTYVIRMYVYAQTASTTSSRSVRIKNVAFTGTAISPAGTQPSVTTNNTSNVTRYTADANGTVTAGTLTITTSGLVWGTAANPTVALSTKTTNGPTASGSFTHTMTGLTAGTTYHVRAYVTSESGNTFYGNDLSFTTSAPVAPILTTTAASNILSTKATSGGNITDSGGVAVTQRGVAWSTSPNPTTANSTTVDGSGSGSFTSLLTGLTPSTLYYVRAYATNSVGTSYGNQISFTTAPPTPVINAVPQTLNFGNVVVNTTAPNLTYTLSASVLSPASGNITITAPAGFQISLSNGTGFASSINVPYTGGALPNTTIYVRFTPTLFGAYTGTITHSGGGASGAYVDNVTVTGTGIQSPGDVSNMGTDFWVGYGYQALMTGNNNQDMVLYLSSKQDAVVTIEIPGTGYTATYNVQANVALSTNPLPKTGTEDARLNSTGTLNRAIHVYSNGIPIAVWAHIYAGSSSGATMVLPTNTWGTDYTALTTGGQTNSGIPHSFFFVMAAEDNTVVDITPSADITATATGTTVLYPANVMFSVTLNKGQVFNALGRLNSSQNGVDLTGSVIKARDCKKIALFTGNGRVQLNVGGCSYTNGGSDNFIQQMFPKAAWGNRYLIVPFRDMEAGFIRIVVSDPATIVRVNGTPTTATLNQFYYQIESDTTMLIESDRPVMVAQYVASNSCNGTGLPDHPSTGANGDPEMVIVSPVQQAINDVTVFSATQYNIQNNYINVVVKNAGVASFQLDGVNVSSAFQVHQREPNYSYAVFTGLQGGVSHRLTSNEPFNAIAYGFSTNSTNESYGYNAGTNVRDLNTFLGVQNSYTNNTGIVAACKDNPFNFTVAIPYKSNNLTWSFGANPNLSPNSTVVQNPAAPVDSVLRDGTWLYIYKINTAYTFNAVGTYNVTIIADNPTADGCAGLRTINLSVNVFDKPKADFTFTHNGCPVDSVRFTDASNGSGRNVVKWGWNFGDGVSDSTRNPVHLYATPNQSYNVSFRAVSDLGCYHDTVKVVNIPGGPVASFNAPDTACLNTAVSVSSTSSTTVGTLVKWTWNFGDGSPAEVVTNGNPRTHTYTSPGNYTITLQVESSPGCMSTVFSKPITIVGVKANFTFSGAGCQSGAVSFTGSPSTLGNNTVTNISWNFGDPGSGANNTSTLSNPTHLFSTGGTFNVTFHVESNKGCSHDSIRQVTIAPTPVASFTAPATGCVSPAVTFTNASTISSGTIASWAYNFGDPASGANNTSTAQSPTHVFSGPGTYTVSLTVTSAAGCVSTVFTKQIIISANPVADFTFPAANCANTSVSFTGSPAGMTTYAWNFGDPSSGANNTASVQSPGHQFSAAGSYNVVFTATSAQGCVGTVTKPVAITAVLANPVVTATNISFNTITFSWAPVTGATGYEVSVNNGPFAAPSSGATGTTHVVSGLNANQTVNITVRALGATACANSTGTASATTILPNLEIYVPNTFSPDGIGDQRNEKLYVFGNNIKSLKMRIFNQWGQMIYENSDPSQGWDGTAQGKVQPVGVYVYVVTVTLNDGKVINKKGSVNLIR